MPSLPLVTGADVLVMPGVAVEVACAGFVVLVAVVVVVVAER